MEEIDWTRYEDAEDFARDLGTKEQKWLFAALLDMLDKSVVEGLLEEEGYL